MFNFRVFLAAEGRTRAWLSDDEVDYEISFFAGPRNTRVIATVNKNEDGVAFRASGSVFRHYDVRAEGGICARYLCGNDHDTGGRAFDDMRSC